MNNKNKILVGCLALLLVLSVGYALFSETITINGTATAKGSFDILPSCQAGFDYELLAKVGLSATELPEVGYDESSCTVNGSTVSMKTNLKYPTAQRGFTMKFKNAGTMDAVVLANGDNLIKNDSITVYNSDDSVYKNLNSSSSEFSTYLKEFGQFFESTLAIIETGNGEIIQEGSDEWQARILDSTNKTSEHEYYLKLEPNDTLIITAWAFWDEEATMNGYSAETTETATQYFQQVTTDMFENPDGFTCYSGC